MRVKRTAAVEQTLCLDERLSRRQRQAFRDAFNAIRIVRQRSPQPVPRAGTLGATGRIAVPIATGRRTHSASTPSADTNKATHSTWCVIGKRSKARRADSR